MGFRLMSRLPGHGLEKGSGSITEAGPLSDDLLAAARVLASQCSPFFFSCRRFSVQPHGKTKLGLFPPSLP